jgi:protein-S-isoprenylcysteine O-methyltransferase Ste14
MGIGGSIFLIAVGAIIAFGVHIQMGWLDLSVVGWVLMLAGFVGLVLTLWFWNSRRRRVVVQPTERQVVRGPNDTVIAEDNYGAPPPDRRV